MRIDLDQAGRRAKELLRAARAGDAGALARMREDRPPRLADAQHAIAAELGFASWPALVAGVEGASGDREAAAAELSVELEDVGSRSGILRVTELSYVTGRPVRISVRHRGERYYIDDMGTAVAIAGRPPGWRDAAERAVKTLGWNINRDGVVSMQCVDGERIDWFIQRTAEASVAVLEAVLEIGEEPGE